MRLKVPGHSQAVVPQIGLHTIGADVAGTAGLQVKIETESIIAASLPGPV